MPSRIDDRLDFRRGLRSDKVDEYTTGKGVQLPVRAIGTTITASKTLTESESGQTIIVNAPNLTITLPTARAGLNYRFLLGPSGISTSSGLAISPASADCIACVGLTAVDNKDLLLAGSGDSVGDSVRILGTGLDAFDWVVIEKTATCTKES